MATKAKSTVNVAGNYTKPTVRKALFKLLQTLQLSLSFLLMFNGLYYKQQITVAA